MSDMLELKDCPFCGTPAHFIERENTHYNRLGDLGVSWDVGCETDGCYLFQGADWYFTTKEESVAAWNTRADSEIKPYKAALEALVDAVEREDVQGSEVIFANALNAATDLLAEKQFDEKAKDKLESA